MPPFVLTVLKIVLLLLLYFFIYRAVRAIVLDLYGRKEREPRRTKRSEAKTRPVPRRGRGGAPRQVVVLDERGKKVESHRLAGTLQVGRSSSCQIRPQDSYLSQVHARISERNGAWVVEDMGSTNGTYLNRRKVTVPTEVSSGDRVQVGKTILEFRR